MRAPYYTGAVMPSGNARRVHAAGGAVALMGPMLGHQQQPRLGQVEHLASDEADRRRPNKGRAAAGASFGEMIDLDIGSPIGKASCPDSPSGRQPSRRSVRAGC
jgi:hypothetical protein